MPPASGSLAAAAAAAAVASAQDSGSSSSGSISVSSTVSVTWTKGKNSAEARVVVVVLRQRALAFDPQHRPADGQPHVASSPAEPVKVGKWEPAGLSFHEAALRLLGLLGEEGDGGGEGGKGEAGGLPSSSSSSASVDPSAWESSRRSSSSASSGKKKGGKDGKGGEGEEAKEQDHYALLGLAHLRYLATEEQIRKSYRDAALKFHPDKQASMLMEEKTEEAKEAKKEEIETKFKAIQLAYEVLMDPTKRRVFDSTDEFDDDIPGDCAADSFFQVYGPVFARNSKWSAVTPGTAGGAGSEGGGEGLRGGEAAKFGGVPQLGDWDTPMAEVDKFYDFWWAFKSWREFPNEDEFDLESAEGREHKRWMERQNAKLRERAKKDEVSRIRQLVENAYKRDPRILKRKEEEKREKQRKKEERNRERAAKEEEEKKAAEEERLRREEEEKKAAEEAAVLRKQKEKEKKLMRKERARLRTAAADCMVSAVAAASGAAVAAAGKVSEDNVESLCQGLDLTKIKLLCERLEQGPPKNGENEEGEGGSGEGWKASLLRTWLKAIEMGSWEGDTPSPAAAAAAKAAEAAAAKGEVGSKVSPPEEESKELQQQQPQQQQQLQQKQKVQQQQEKPQEPSRPWSRQEVELLRKAVNKFPKGTSQRWEVIAGYLKTGRTAEEIVKAVKTVLLQKPDDSRAFDSFLQRRKNPKDIASPLSTREGAPDDVAAPAKQTDGASAMAGKKGDAPAKKAADLDSSNAAEVAEAPKANGVAASESKAAGSAAAAAAAAEADGDSKGETSDGDAWSEAQELALVKALKAFPKETDKRWERIAAAVPGRTKVQCFKKFTEMRQNFREKRSGTSAT